MGTFLLQLLKRYERIAQVSPHSTMRWKKEFAEILIYIQTNYRTVPLDDVFRKFSYSQRQIIRIILGSTDKTFTQLLTQLRMEKAVSLLKQKNMPIEQIAQEVGYSSLSGFYHSFTAYYGISPGQWQTKNETAPPNLQEACPIMSMGLALLANEKLSVFA